LGTPSIAGAQAIRGISISIKKDLSPKKAIERRDERSPSQVKGVRMSKTPLAVVQLANKYRKGAPLDLIRGGTKKGVHYPGLMEQQHPVLWGIPRATEVVNILCNVIPMETDGVAGERVFRAIVGHTWRYQKAGEFITWEHLLKGKFDALGGLLVAPAKVAGATLTKALRSATATGLLIRHEVHLGSRELIFFLPNPLFSGGVYTAGKYAAYDTYADRSTYSSVMGLIREIKDPLIWTFGEDEGRPTRLYRELVTSLRAAELIAVVAEASGSSLQQLAERRRSTRAELQKELENARGMTEALREYIESRETELETDEMVWFMSIATTTLLQEATAVGKILNSSQLIPQHQPLHDLLPRALVHRLGIPLLSLNPHAWKCAWEWRDQLPEDVASSLEATKQYVSSGWYCDLG
jgi:hypothetical protein